MAGPWERYQQQPAQPSGPWERYRKPAEPKKPSTMGDVAASGASGVARGALDLLGLPGTIGDAVNSAGQWALRKGYQAVTGDEPSAQGGGVERFFAGPTEELEAQMVGGGSNPLSGQNIRKVASQATDGATEYQPKTTAGKYAGTVGEFLPGAAAFGGGSIGNLARFGVLPGLASEGAGQATEGSALEPYARVAAALMAPAAPAMASRAISPFRAAPGRMAAADVLRSEGIRPTAGQVTGNKGLQYAEAELGGARAADMMDDQARAFTEAAMRRAGGAGLATPENMASLKAQIGQGFDDVAARNSVRVDQSLVDDFNGTMREYNRVLGSEQKQIVGNIAQDIVDRFKAGSGSLSGKDYQMLRSRLSKRAQNAAGSDNELAEAYRGLRNALDRGMERSVRPEDAGEWARLNKEYGNMKTLQKASVGGGEDAGLGIISPARLRMAASSGKNLDKFTTGKSDFSELSKAGQAMMTPLPQSGTNSRQVARNLGPIVPMMIGSATGAAAGGQENGILGALGGAALGALAPKVAGKALMSRPAQAYLMNQAAPAVNFADPRYAAVIAALLGQGAGPPALPGR